MGYSEYIKIIPGAETAVLFIHGIVGSPKHFTPFIPLVPKHISVQALLLEGHGRGVRDFSGASMQKWILQVEEAVFQLSRTHKRVLIAAHSMGTLFAIQQAVKEPVRIGGLFLLAVPLRVAVKPAMVLNAAKVYLGKVKQEDTMAVATRDACSVALDKRFWLYLGWIPRYLELFSQIRKTRKLVKDICVPCWVYQSWNDEMVADSSRKVLARNPDISVNILSNSAHYYYEETDEAYLLKQFQSWLFQFG